MAEIQIDILFDIIVELTNPFDMHRSILGRNRRDLSPVNYRRKRRGLILKTICLDMLHSL